jgi:hypothetical protein
MDQRWWLVKTLPYTMPCKVNNSRTPLCESEFLNGPTDITQPGSRSRLSNAQF